MEESNPESKDWVLVYQLTDFVRKLFSAHVCSGYPLLGEKMQKKKKDYRLICSLTS